MFGDIVKVTPSSKVVGDMALMMVSQGLATGRRSRSQTRHRLPHLRRRDAARRPWPAAGRLAGRVADKGAQGRSADRRRVPARCWRPPISRRNDPRSKSGWRRRVSDQELASYQMYPKVFTDFAARGAQIWPRFRAADARLLLWHAGRRRGEPRDRKGQGARCAASGDRRDRRGRAGPHILRTQRPTPHRQGAEPVGDGVVAGAPQGGGRKRSAYRRADAGRRGDDRGEAGAAGEGGRSPADPRGDEDGDVALRAPRRQDQRGSGLARPAGRRKGPADCHGARRERGRAAPRRQDPCFKWIRANGARPSNARPDSAR